MKIIKTKSGVDVTIYSSAKEMSITRYTEFQKYLVMEAGDLNTTLQRVKAFLEEGESDNAKVEINNAILSLNNVLNGVGYYTYAFAVLVAEIGGKVACDVSESGLSVLVERLKELDLEYGVIETEVNSLKKK